MDHAAEDAGHKLFEQSGDVFVAPWEPISAVMGWQRVMDATLRERCSTTLLQQWLLLMLHTHLRFTVASATEMLQLNYTTVAEAICVLERRGCVVKGVDPNDRRLTVVELTDAGRELFGELDRMLLEVSARVWSGFEKRDRRRALGLFNELLVGVGKNRKFVDLIGAAAGHVPHDYVRGDSAFINACAQVSMEFRWMCEKEGCPASQAKLLLLLCDRGSLRPKDVARLLAQRQSDVSKLLSKVERAGLAGVRAGRSKRERAVVLTERGHAVAARLTAQTEHLLCTRFPRPEDRAFMADVFSRLLELLRAEVLKGA